MNPLEELIIQTMEATDVPERSRVLGPVLAKADSPVACALLCASIANIIGNMPDEKWEEMVAFKFPACPTEGCNCHLVQEQLLKALIPVRQIFMKATENPDEKGLAE